eukprot:754350-Amphidinium_carterae.1
MAKRFLGEDAVDGAVAALKRVFSEAYAVSALDIQEEFGLTDEAKPRKLPHAERAERAQVQQKSISGFLIKGFSEPSHALVDLSCAMYTENSLRYIEWAKCTRREQE